MIFRREGADCRKFSIGYIAMPIGLKFNANYEINLAGKFYTDHKFNGHQPKFYYPSPTKFPP
ncbi:hypothetical protein [Campylobacter curvus]|uniref:hypothetical protein n=1 Tax=Campylobacter curvus TaxID=200 RepID=UPI000375C89D|nr:hypothetical protein [Campylobacter curvus]UEB49445.1 hypothetical protein LK426_07415 [Campylobacter curvus]